MFNARWHMQAMYMLIRKFICTDSTSDSAYIQIYIIIVKYTKKLQKNDKRNKTKYPKNNIGLSVFNLLATP